MGETPTYVVFTEAKAPAKKVIHQGAHIRADGAVSAACFKRPHAIDLRRASWTIRPDAVTCARCKRAVTTNG